MAERGRESRARRGWWALAMLTVIIAFVYATMGAFNKTFTSYTPVTLNSDRAGLVMEVGAKVKLRGVQVGEVGAVTGGKDPITLKLKIFRDQAKFIPANVGSRIEATTIFGAKYVELIYPSDPSPQRLRAGAVLTSSNVSTEVNTVFENLVGLLDQVDPAKLNAILSALAEGVRGQGQRIGAATTDLNQVLLALNPRSETIRADFRSLKGFADTYSCSTRSASPTAE
jgi:phospholipid/cholesterol/gamma-HCH transport system substrate-binding protein